MKIEISKIVPNPFRDFGLDPIDDVQVERLRVSIRDLGFFTAVPARKRGGVFQQACNHHLLEAAKLEGREFIEVVVDDYTDDEMRRIMAVENLTQRGGATTATLDSVNAFVFQCVYDALSDRTLSTSKESSPQQKGMILRNGPGAWLIYAAINGFHPTERDERKAEDEKAELITLHAVNIAVKTLQDSGKMAETVAKAYAVVEAERAEDAAKAAEEVAKAEAKRQAEEERQRKAEQAAIEKAEREAETRRKAEEDAKKRQAARWEQERLRKSRERAEFEAKKKREEEIAAEKKRRQDAANRQAEIDRDRKAKADKAAAEKAKVAAQLAQERIYDSRCAQLFPDEDYAEVFRKAVTSPGGREFITRDQQYPLAQKIVKQMKDTNAFSNHKEGTAYVDEFVSEEIGMGRTARRLEQEKTEAALRAAKAMLRVDKLWADVKRDAIRIEQTMKQLVKEYTQWNFTLDGDFPSNYDLTNTFGILSRLEEMMVRMYGDRFGKRGGTPPEADTYEPEIIEPRRINDGRK